MSEQVTPPLPIAMTVDLEDWYHSILEIEPNQWPRCEDRVIAATENLLEVLEQGGVRATFFVLGHVAELHPKLVPRILSAGHEIACHGYSHRLVHQQTPAVFRADLHRALDILCEQTNQPIRGYRAAYWSITRSCTWAFDIIAEAGLDYDSSVYPTLTPLYGIPDAPLAPFRLVTANGAVLREFPPSVLRFPLRNIPFAGGLYMRLLPFSFVCWALSHLQRQGRPPLVYIHPPEFDPDKPRLAMSLPKRVLHYANLDAFRHKVPVLLRKFSFSTVSEILDQREASGQMTDWTIDQPASALNRPD